MTNQPTAILALLNLIRRTRPATAAPPPGAPCYVTVRSAITARGVTLDARGDVLAVWEYQEVTTCIFTR